MDLRVGGPRCMEFAANESPDIGAIRYCFRFLIFGPFLNKSTTACELCLKTGKISHFSPPVKNNGGLVVMSI